MKKSSAIFLTGVIAGALPMFVGLGLMIGGSVTQTKYKNLRAKFEETEAVQNYVQNKVEGLEQELALGSIDLDKYVEKRTELEKMSKAEIAGVIYESDPVYQAINSNIEYDKNIVKAGSITEYVGTGIYWSAFIAAKIVERRELY